MSAMTNGGSGRFYSSGLELAEDLGATLLGVVPPGPQQISEITAAGPVHESIASLLISPQRAAALEIVMIGGVPGDTERAPFTWSLAQALGSAGRRVLVVDADLGISGSLARAHGFAELVRSGAALDGLLRRTDHPHIDLLPPGSTPLSAVERCEADELAGAFRALRSAAEIVLIGAPILSRSGKASRFVTFADAILLVVRLDLDTRDMVRRAYLQLWGVEAPLLGLVSVEEGRRPQMQPAFPAAPVSREAKEPEPEAAGEGERSESLEERALGAYDSPARRVSEESAEPVRVEPSAEPPPVEPIPVPPLPEPPARARRRGLRRDGIRGSGAWIAGGVAVLVAATGLLLVPTLMRGPETPPPASPVREKTPTTGSPTTPASTLPATPPAEKRAGDETAPSAPAAVERSRPGASDDRSAERPTEPAATEPIERASPPLPAETATAGEARYTLQVAAFTTEEEAAAERARLAPTGYEISVARADLAAKGTWYRVFLGRFASEEDARKASEAIRARDLVKEVILRRLDRPAGVR